MNNEEWLQVGEAKKEALAVLLHNNIGPFKGLPRTAGWGYPEPYTRDLMICILGIAASGNKELLANTKKVLETLASNQTEHGHIPSLVHNKEDRGASDTTPLFLFGVGIFRKISGIENFLDEAVEKAMIWMEYQSPSDRSLVAQLPTSDWRDEQWVLGYGLFVNTVVYAYLKLFGKEEKAEKMHKAIQRFAFTKAGSNHHLLDTKGEKHKPYFCLWTYKVFNNTSLDLLGNSIAILSGIASASRADDIIHWIESECEHMQKSGQLKLNLPPNFFPFTQKDDPEWHDRYALFNMPGDYHNGGIWPFICGMYIAALVASKKYQLAEEKLLALTDAVRLSYENKLAFGFNEWIKAQTGEIKGQEWQSWSAAMYLYAVQCVEEKRTPFFDEMRKD